MPIDASIIPTKQTLPNFGAISDTLAQIMGLQKGNLGLQQGQLALQQGQQTLAANQAVSQAFKENTDEQGNINYPAIIRALSQNPDAAVNLPQIAGQLYQTQNAQTTAQNAKLDNIRKMTDNLMPIAADWESKGDKITQQDIADGFAKAIATGAVTPSLAMTHFGTVPKDQKDLAAWVKSEVTHLSNAQTALGMITPSYQSNVGGNQPGFVNPYTQTITPANYANPQNANPSSQATVPNAATPANPAATTATQTPLPLKYPVRQAGDVSPQLPEEAADRESGQKYVNGLASRRADLSTANRNLDEVLAKAKSLQANTISPSSNAVANLGIDVLNKGIRAVHNWANDPDYLELSKNLANVQMSNMAAQGGSLDTVAGQSLLAHANGTSVYPPEVLSDIAKRAKADLTNIDLQGQAAQKFAQKYGYNNMNTFKQLWGNNADSKLFEMRAIYNDTSMSDQEKKDARDKLLGITPNMSAQDKQKLIAPYAQKNAILEKLVNTGGL
jgi:hypothetical protein